MGEVYYGVHTSLNRTAAIKVLKSFRDESLKSRFYNEARLQSSLHHPNIAALYDFQEIEGQLCIFMEFVDGESLEDLIERRFFAVEEALSAFHTVCEAIAFIHRKGILHRDIKAQNIKLDSNGRIKLLDFGIAKDAESEKLTKTGGVIGTPSYIAPEQLNSHPADFQTDVWALGILLYEMLTGIQPFKTDSMIELYLKIQDGGFTPVRKINPAVPHEVSQIVECCLKKDRNQRFRTAEEVAQETARVLYEKYNLAKADSLESGNFTPVNSEHSLPGQNSMRQTLPEKKKNWLIPVILGSSFAVLILFGLIGIGLWAVSGGDSGNRKSSVNEKTNKVLTESKPEKNGDANTSKIEIASTNENLIELQIDVIEGSAQLIRDGVSVGNTPYKFKARTGEKIDITLKREGYKDFDTKIEVSNGKRFYTFALQKK